VQCRANIVALCQQGVENAQIALFLGCHIQTVRTWVGRFHNDEPVSDRARPGPRAKFLEETSQRIIAFFCQFKTLPGYARWTLSTACQYFKQNPEILGEGVTISRASIHRLLGAHALKPHRFQYFLQLSDPEFFSKMEHIIDVYQSTPKNLFCFDECTGIQALESTAPKVPVGKNHGEYREVEYIRHDTVSIFSVLEVHTGQVFTKIIKDHTASTIIDVFTQHVATASATETLHYICDNYSSHSTIEVCEAVGQLCGVEVPQLPSLEKRRAWLGKTDKRIVFHFLPYHGSWLNLIENWFGIMKKNCLDGVSVRSQETLAENITEFTDTWNQHYAHPYKWTYDGKNLRGKTVRKFTYWLREESSEMTGKFLKKQLVLMTNLIGDDKGLVTVDDWTRLTEVFGEKQDYLESVVDNIDAQDYKKTKGKTEEARQSKILEKIDQAKISLREKISGFKILIDTAVTKMINCAKEVTIQ
jgi:transposase